ncbi:MAG TPA: SMP-30/gluconolactonase/LRE family protein [Opitutus sp.]|nr:SMP-30/gluconolactonase/LRE family protein [Opitutus sp.]
MKSLLPLFGLTVVWSASVFAAPSYPSAGSIERLDPAFDALIAPDAKLERLAEGFNWSEGPVWFEGSVLFSDVPENVVYRWKEGMTAAEVFLKPSGLLTPAPGFREPGSNGLAVDAKGRLLLAQHGERRVARWEDGQFTSLADRHDGKRFNSPNDLAVRKNGDIYFTDPSYGLEGTNNSPLKELPFNGVYRVTPGGEVTLLAPGLSAPNGIAFSPDESVLYIGVSDGREPRVVAYDVKADGTLENERTFFDARPRREAGYRGGCDGLKVDREGNVWATGPGGVLVIAPRGKLLGALLTGQATANCGWGGADGSVLYITADMFLMRVQTKTKGAGW